MGGLAITGARFSLVCFFAMSKMFARDPRLRAVAVEVALERLPSPTFADKMGPAIQPSAGAWDREAKRLKNIPTLILDASELVTLSVSGAQ